MVIRSGKPKLLWPDQSPPIPWPFFSFALMATGLLYGNCCQDATQRYGVPILVCCLCAYVPCDLTSTLLPVLVISRLSPLLYPPPPPPSLPLPTPIPLFWFTQCTPDQLGSLVRCGQQGWRMFLVTATSTTPLQNLLDPRLVQLTGPSRARGAVSGGGRCGIPFP